MSASSNPWYKRQYYGAKAQRMWQAGIATGVLLTMVIIPTWFEYWMGVQKSNHTKTIESSNAIDMQRMVFDKRMEFRKQLKEGGGEIKIEKL